MPLPLGAAALALKCAARLPNDGSAAFPLSALAWCVAFPQRRLLLFPLAALCYASRFPTSSLVRPTPAPDLLVPHSSPKLPLRVPSGAGRSSRCVRLAVDVCFALPTDSPRMTGATRSAKPPKTERGVFRSSELGERTAALGLPPCGGRRPRSNEAGTIPRTANRVSGVVCASRGALRPLRGVAARALDLRSARLPSESSLRSSSPAHFRLRLFSPDGENRSPRWGRLRDTTTDDNSARGGA